MQYRKQSHSTYYTRYHLVFVTKYRRKLFVKNIQSYLMAVLRNIAKQYPELEILEMNTDKDHIHLLMIIPPKIAVSDVVRILKTNASRALRKKFPFITQMYEHSRLGMWSDGYFVSTVGINEATIQLYIQRQGTEDKGEAQLELY